MSSILEKRAVRDAALPITVEQYHRLSDQAIVAERTELLQGVIIEQMTKSPRHTYVVQVLEKWLNASVGSGLYIRKEEPLTLADSEPEPDLAVVQGAPQDYRSQHPATADLVIEVAIATLDLDRDKADVYAAAGVAEYWIVAPDEGAVEVYRDPSPAGYRGKLRYADGETLLRPQRLPQAALRLATIFD
jgi:Uma2 family endonuclease